MAGGGYHPYKADPALDRWQNMHSTMYQRFRLTPSKARNVFIWGLTIPVLTYYAAQYTDVSANAHGRIQIGRDGGLTQVDRVHFVTMQDRWELRGKTRQDSLLRHAPAAPAAEGADEE